MTIRDTLNALTEDGATFHHFLKGAENEQIDIDGGKLPTLAGLAKNALAGVGTLSDLSTVSSSLVAMQPGSRTFVVEAGKKFMAGQWVTITYDGNNAMTGIVTVLTGVTLVVDVKQILGSGTYNAWTINLSGLPGISQVVAAPPAAETKTKLITTMPWE